MSARTAVPVALLLLLAAAAASGCAGSGAAASRELSTAQFDDVPAPPGFVMDTDYTYSYAEGGAGPVPIRMGRIEYTGTGDAEAVVGWYLEQMPRTLHGWERGVRVEGADAAARFARGADRCLVAARREGGLLRVVVERNTPAAQRQE
jgi:hypothetical protein